MANEEQTMRRYFKTYDEDDTGCLICDAVWIDRTTGAEVLRYDAADPANTEVETHGAMPDSECFANKGLDINERVPISQCLEKFGGTKK